MTTIEKTNGKSATAIEEVSNDAAELILPPYRCEVSIIGTAPLLFHRWSCESVSEKEKAAKGSKTKKTDDIKSYVYRLANKHLGLPGEYLRQAIIQAAKYRQDPRSPRKSMMDLMKAALTVETELADLGAKDWDFIDQRRVVIQRAAITRQRPAMETGWTATFIFLCLLPQYVSSADLHACISQAGMLVGLGDFRPSYGRFMVERFGVLE